MSAVLEGAFDALPTTVNPVKARPVRLPAPQRYYTFSEFNWIPSFLEVLLQVSADRMMFSTDHPHQSMTEATTFLAGLPLTPHDHDGIAQGNAERVMDI